MFQSSVPSVAATTERREEERRRREARGAMFRERKGESCVQSVPRNEAWRETTNEERK
jgi:hypothetical protein